jgi:threonine/homoserine/homoserine lactone efflux protein
MLTVLTSPTFAAFLGASLILAITPGPGVLYIVSRTMREGRKAGLASVCGIAVGNLGNAAAASIGLAAILAISRAAFAVVKFAGAGYLIFLGLKALRAKPSDDSAGRPRPDFPGALFREGFFVALLNPKTALFFGALLPQFISPSAPAFGQSLVLGCVFVSIAMCTDSIYVLTAAALASRIGRGLSAYSRFVSAATLIGLGVYAAFASPRPTR